MRFEVAEWEIMGEQQLPSLDCQEGQFLEVLEEDVLEGRTLEDGS
jgi:hypothetical protein